MSNKSSIGLFLVYLFLMTGCKNSSTEKEPLDRKDGFTETLQTKEDSLFKEIMEGHDYGMARMGKISKYRSQLKKKLDSINLLQIPKIDLQYHKSLIELQKKLDDAEYAMNVWMEEFKIDSAKENKDARLKYLEEEKHKVQLVKEAILRSLQSADSILKRD